MSEATPTRSLLVALRDEQHAMREGHAFLDEKCLLLAGEMMRELRRHAELQQRCAALRRAADAALLAALARHGLQGLQVQPAAPAAGEVALARRSLLGIGLLDAAWTAPQSPPPAAVNPSPEVPASRRAFQALAAALIELAGVSTNLARLEAEYRRSVRRVRALQDLLLPEIARSIADIDARLEDFEREDAVATRGWLRRQAQAGPG